MDVFPHFSPHHTTPHHLHRSGTDEVVDFEFTATPDSSMQILTTWNIRLLESITFNPQQLNQISSVLNAGTLPSEAKKGKSRTVVSKSFRAAKNLSVNRDQDSVRRADSFSKLQSYRTDISGSSPIPGAAGVVVVVGGLSQGGIRVGGLPPLPREANTRSWGGDDVTALNGAMGNLSQDSFFTHGTGLGHSPPPLPPRPSYISKNYNGDDSDDPDYAYIKEDEVKGPKNTTDTSASNAAKQHRPSISVDDVLNRLEQDIIRDNRAKEQRKSRRTQTLNRAPMSHQVAPLSHQVAPLSLGPRITFPPAAKPQDYMDFVPSKRSQIKSTSSEPEKTNIAASHIRSTSEPDSRPFHSPSRVLSQPPPVFEDNEDVASASPLPPITTREHKSQPVRPMSDHNPADYSTFELSSAPALPPRTWRNASTSSYNSLGSSSNLGYDPTGSISSASNVAVFSGTNPSEKGVSLSEGDASPTSEGTMLSGLSSGSGPVVSSENITSNANRNMVKFQARKITPPHSSDRENKAAPTTIPEETMPQASNIMSRPTTTTTTGAPPNAEVSGQNPYIPPPLPPRSPNKEKLSQKSSTSSTSSVSSSSSSTGRCPRCRSLRKSKTSVSKTVSLDQRNVPTTAATKRSPDDCRKSLPDLADMPEEGKCHRHTYRGRERHCSRCSPGSSTDALHHGDSNQTLRSTSLHSFDYLQLVGEEHKDSRPTSSIENELGAEMDLLNSCLQTLEYLEHKVNGVSSASGAAGTNTMTSVVSNSSHSNPAPSSGGKSQWPAVGAKAKPPAQGDVKKSVYMQAMKETQMVLEELSQPLSTYNMGKVPEIKKLVSNGHTSQFSKQSTLPGFTSSSSSPGLRGVRGYPNGTLPQRSSSSMAITTPPLSSGHAPPVPPRSMVSLTNSVAGLNSTSQHKIPQTTRSTTQLHPQTTPTSKSGYNRSISSSNVTSHHNPAVRSSSSIGVYSSSHATPIRNHPSLTRHQRLNHMEASGQSTVFIHHLKDSRVRGLTHLV